MSTWCLQALIVLAATGADGLDRERLEKSLEKKDEAAIKQAFKDNEGEVLPFFDEYMEGGLAAHEKGKPKSETEALHARGIAFAKLADEALGGDVFSKYARAFAGWTPDQQKQFREGQAEYRKSREAAADPAKSLAHLEKSLKLCTPLGDTWGQAMCLSKVAAAQHALGHHAEAIEAATRAAALNGSIHFLGSQVGDLLTRAQCLADTGKTAECERDLNAAMDISKRIKDDKPRADLVKKCEELKAKLVKTKTAEPGEKEPRP